MTDTEITDLIRKWWNNAADDERRWAIYYSMDSIDEYSYVWFVAKELGIPGYNPEHYTYKQAEFCCHVCDILKNMTAGLISQSL